MENGWLRNKASKEAWKPFSFQAEARSSDKRQKGFELSQWKGRGKFPYLEGRFTTTRWVIWVQSGEGEVKIAVQVSGLEERNSFPKQTSITSLYMLFYNNNLFTCLSSSLIYNRKRSTIVTSNRWGFCSPSYLTRTTLYTLKEFTFNLHNNIMSW